MRTTVGPLPPHVYWRRRLTLLGVLVLAFVGVRFWIGSGTSDADRNTLPKGSSAAADGTPGHPYIPVVTPIPATPTPSPTPTPTPSPSPSPTPVAPPAIGACADTDLQLTAVTDARTYAVGGTPLLSMMVRNVSKRTCRRDLGPGAREFLITSGPAHTWSSRDCDPARGSVLVTLLPGTIQTFSVTWSGQRSQPGCPAARPVAAAGTYRLQVRVGTLTSTPTVFHLT